MITTGYVLYKQQKKRKAAANAEKDAKFEEQKKLSQREAFYRSIEGVELSGSAWSLARQEHESTYRSEDDLSESGPQDSERRPKSFEDRSSPYDSKHSSYDSRHESYESRPASYDSAGTKAHSAQRPCSPITEEPRRMRSAKPKAPLHAKDSDVKELGR